ncbi:unnamed protein product [Echinostoma caproni]|uniref:Sister chromatid cohesion protein n=1 Tax=Echinostoma caproni TaxID=27848 RepID=A0A183AN23_9TREM|nr:unnamed protein product [Echinostoma caproni]
MEQSNLTTPRPQLHRKSVNIIDQDHMMVHELLGSPSIDGSQRKPIMSGLTRVEMAHALQQRWMDQSHELCQPMRQTDQVIFQLDQNRNAWQSDSEQPDEQEIVNSSVAEAITSSSKQLELLKPTNVNEPLPSDQVSSIRSASIRCKTSVRTRSPDGNVVESEIEESYPITIENPDYGAAEAHKRAFPANGYREEEMDGSNYPDINVVTCIQVSHFPDPTNASTTSIPPPVGTSVGASTITPLPLDAPTGQSKTTLTEQCNELDRSLQDKLPNKLPDQSAQQSASVSASASDELQVSMQQKLSSDWQQPKNLHQPIQIATERVQHSDPAKNVADLIRTKTSSRTYSGQGTLKDDVPPITLARTNLLPKEVGSVVNGSEPKNERTLLRNLPPQQLAQKRLKITDPARVEIDHMRRVLDSVCDDLVSILESILNRDFTACTVFYDHIRVLPMILGRLIAKLGYSPFEKELWQTQESLMRMMEEVKTKPSMILLRLVELGFYIFEVGYLIGEKILPFNFASRVHAIQTRIHVSSLINVYFCLGIDTFLC